ncbi:PREDICTED: taste receptor type 1 member 1-like [Cyprinodon variegatus]|uniref:Taste receptor type 1 member 1-like n=1 Tax=Cyprinodon variegatus TaxID=28743 RepID=A0A3Q2DME2_CYPVA|nr:PREDICTED: taste receptor type 1 member 1-like [Cyprinodon variegatus]
MCRIVVHVCLLGLFLQALTQPATASEFSLDGDFLIGGLFDIHQISDTVFQDRSETITCSSQRLTLSSYRRFQVMRFSVEEINNSTDLLPSVTLGYEIYDHCSDTHNFPSIFNLISVNGSIKPWNKPLTETSKVIAVVGTYTSTATLNFAPLFMTDLIPLVSYGAASSVFSNKYKFPSFFRTIHPNKDVLKVVLMILKEFNWRWVSFLHIDDDYGRDGRDLFIKSIEDTEICLAYTKGLNTYTNYLKTLQTLISLKINVIIVFAPEWTAEDLIKAAIKYNITNKVWIAVDAWSLHKTLPKENGIRNIGTVIGIAEPILEIPGFRDFIHSFKALHQQEDKGKFCNQICNCTNVAAEDIINADPSFSFSVYSAVYAIAHALHSVLQCGAGKCNSNVTVHHQMILPELRRSNFSLLNQRVQFDENGDPKYGGYSIVFWNQSGEAENVGYYNFPPSSQFFINKSKIQWHKDGEVPVSLCSQECPEGHYKVLQETHKCCFTCTICKRGTYVNSTGDYYECTKCKEKEWSEEGSTTCHPRLVEYTPYSSGEAMMIILGTLIFVCLAAAIFVLFLHNYKSPVVKSAGGPMCFLILACLSLSCISVFFNFGIPTAASCVLKYFPFFLFFTVCIACFLVRSFQIVYVFKIATKYPILLSWWMKYQGQWLFIIVVFVIQTILLIHGYSSAPPTPEKITQQESKTIILWCNQNVEALSGFLILFSILCFFCFIFSYMGKDLPKNYNEAKSITFCLLLLVIIWIIYATTHLLNHSSYTSTFNALALLSSLYSFLFWYFLPRCYIIVFEPQKNTQQYFLSLIQSYAETSSM